MNRNAFRDALIAALWLGGDLDVPGHCELVADIVLAMPEIQALLANEAEIKRLRALVDDYESGINWHTTCTNCAKLMDVNYDQYCEIDRLRAAGDQLADYVREAGPGLHDDMAILACWQQARRG